MDLDVVEGSIIAVDWLSLHQIQGFESIDHLHKRSSTLPNTVYCLFSFDSLLYVMKNWLPFVFGPLLAIDTIPLLSCFSVSTNSSSNGLP